MPGKIIGHCAGPGSCFRVAKPFMSMGRTWNVGTYVYVRERIAVDSSDIYYVALIREDKEGLVPPQWCHDQAHTRAFDDAVLDKTFVPVDNKFFDERSNSLDVCYDSVQWLQTIAGGGAAARRRCEIVNLIYQRKGNNNNGHDTTSQSG